MTTSMAVSVRKSGPYRWLPYLPIVMTLIVLLAGIGLLRFVEYRFVEATG